MNFPEAFFGSVALICLTVLIGHAVDAWVSYVRGFKICRGTR